MCGFVLHLCRRAAQHLQAHQQNQKAAGRLEGRHGNTEQAQQQFATQQRHSKDQRNGNRGAQWRLSAGFGRHAGGNAKVCGHSSRWIANR